MYVKKKKNVVEEDIDMNVGSNTTAEDDKYVVEDFVDDNDDDDNDDEDGDAACSNCVEDRVGSNNHGCNDGVDIGNKYNDMGSEGKEKDAEITVTNTITATTSAENVDDADAGQGQGQMPTKVSSRK